MRSIRASPAFLSLRAAFRRSRGTLDSVGRKAQWMTAYRFVIFPRGKQPDADEVRAFQSFAPALAGQVAYGSSRDDGRLAIAVEGKAFDHLRASDAGFDGVIQRWEDRGCAVVERLDFVKNAAALRPTPVFRMSHDGREAAAPLRFQERLAAKELAAKEAVGRSMLAVERTVQRFAAVERLAAALPYLFVALATVLVLATGWYVRARMLDSSRQQRRTTIERALEEPSRQAPILEHG